MHAVLVESSVAKRVLSDGNDNFLVMMLKRMMQMKRNGIWMEKQGVILLVFHLKYKKGLFIDLYVWHYPLFIKNNVITIICICLTVIDRERTKVMLQN